MNCLRDWKRHEAMHQHTCKKCGKRYDDRDGGDHVCEDDAPHDELEERVERLENGHDELKERLDRLEALHVRSLGS